MGIGISIFLIAVGAILTFAVRATVSGLDISTIGIILMVVGGIGLATTVAIFGRAGRASGGAVVSETYVEEDVVDGTGRRRRAVR